MRRVRRSIRLEIMTEGDRAPPAHSTRRGLRVARHRRLWRALERAQYVAARGAGGGTGTAAGRGRGHTGTGTGATDAGGSAAGDTPEAARPAGARLPEAAMSAAQAGHGRLGAACRRRTPMRPGDRHRDQARQRLDDQRPGAQLRRHRPRGSEGLPRLREHPGRRVRPQAQSLQSTATTGSTRVSTARRRTR